MKKRTNEEKLLMIDEACEMFNEAANLIKKGKRLFHLCGIDFCGGFCESANKNTYDNNLHIYKGIKKFSNLVGVEAEHPFDSLVNKRNKGYLEVRYKNLKFLQSGQEVASTQKKFYFM